MEYLGILTKGAAPEIKKQLSGPAKAANSIKKELTQKYPGIKFQVKSSRYSGGDSVSVHWEFGPTYEEVDALIKKYQYGNFNSMEDLYEYKDDPQAEKFWQEKGSAKYVSASRGYGPTNNNDWFETSIYGQIGKDLSAKQGVPYAGEHTRNIFGQADDRDLLQHVRDILGKSSFPQDWKYQGLGPWSTATRNYTLKGSREHQQTEKELTYQEAWKDLI